MMKQESKIKISPSILAADFGCLLTEVRKVEGEAELLHFDIMDGHFVPNISFGAGVIKELKGKVNLLFDVHLMVEHPEELVDVFSQAGADFLVAHLETTGHLDRLITCIKEKGVKAGVAINPTTPLCFLDYILPRLEMVLLMTVNPGFGAQSFLYNILPKITELRKIARKVNPELDIAVDGGITEKTAPEVVKAGANVLIAGSSVFASPDPAKTIRRLKRSCQQALDSSPQCKKRYYKEE